MSREETVTLSLADVPAQDVNDSINESVVLNERCGALETELAQARSQARLSKLEAAKLASTILEDWIQRRGVTGIDRARKQLLVEALAEAFGLPEVKEAEGVG